MRLIVNADDFGYSPGQNYGIIDAFQKGIVRSATLMANAPATHHAIELAKANPDLGVGVHLVLDMNRPILAPEQVPSLVTAEGVFRRWAYDSLLNLEDSEVEAEWRAQIEYVIGQGLAPTHLDSHHHFHWHPQLIGITCKLAQGYNLPIRSLSENYGSGEEYQVLASVRHVPCVTEFFDTGVSEDFFLNFFANYPHLRDETVELMCHPAFLDDVILTKSSYKVQRVRELAVLKSAKVWQWVDQHNVHLVNFRQL
jgi:predicted glycoside hydrolase/deacetylase ChbG (UPF0249 family)